MASRPKRRRENVDPTASDPEDLDYGAASSPPKPRRSQASKSQASRPKKKQRRSYGDTDEEEDIEDEQSSEGSFRESSVEEEVEVNPLTGRPARRAAKKEVKYEEKSEDDIEDVEQSTEQRDEFRSIPKSKPMKLIVKLNVPSLMRVERKSRSAKPSRRGSTPQTAGTRRSSRIAHDDAQPIIALSDSGRRTQVIRAGTATPEPPPPRATRGSKGVKGLKAPETIVEASQENSMLSHAEAANESEGGSGGLEDAPGDEDEEAHVHDSATSRPASDAQSDAQAIPLLESDAHRTEVVVQDSAHETENDEDDEPVVRGGRQLRSRQTAASKCPATRGSKKKRKLGVDDTSDFEPLGEEAEEENVSSSEDSESPRRKASQKHDTDESSGPGRRSRRIASKTRASQRSRQSGNSDAGSELDPEEVAEEAEELVEERRAKRRKRNIDRLHVPGFSYDDQPKLRSRGNKPDYRILRPDLTAAIEDDEPAPAVTPQRNRRGAAGAYRSLLSTQGPFGGASGPTPLFGGLGGAGAAGDIDSDSSDDDVPPSGLRGTGGVVGMTPTGVAHSNLLAHTHNADHALGKVGGPEKIGNVKDVKLLADADPLGADKTINFGAVGGLDDHINQLKEMVMLPLLYPELFQSFHVTPPRGVLFHGPPGTGKTLLARALAEDVSLQGRKVNFYMRKGADILNKWVGEAEKQLRLLFEEARKSQPSIIFFDEIDGLAPVRSSKQDQIHASIVATLLALMDGMDGRGQVIVIGATNRPDSIDPALRRPGRFDREFYFPLPNKEARLAIIDIHTKGWEPPLQPAFKDQLAELTKGYGGADLRALCTEAALNAVQGTYPQIYSSNKKLIINPSAVKVLSRDFLISVNKMIPSSERSTSSGAAPLTKSVEPLLRKALGEVGRILDEVIPRKRKLTALEEAEYDDREDDMGFERENMQKDFESSRIFRPRVLIRGRQGMGQQYLGAALLNKFDGLFVQSFDLPTLLKDSTRSPEAAVVQLFEEVRRHKPSVIYIPNIDVWYSTLSDSTIRVFTSLLHSLPPTDPVLLLGILETVSETDQPDQAMLRDLFGYSTKNQYHLSRPDELARHEYFGGLIKYIRQSPLDFPDPANRKKRKLAALKVAPAPKAPEGPSKDELKAQRKQDRHTLNLLKREIQPVMDQIKLKYKKFRSPVVDDSIIGYLYDEQNPDFVSTDVPEHQRQQQQQIRPYEIGTDDKGVAGLIEVATNRFFYNLDTVTIEKRLSNGYYKRPRDFAADIRRLAKDAKASGGDLDRMFKANEMVNNVEVDMYNIEASYPVLAEACEQVYGREQERERLRVEKAKQATAQGERVPFVIPNVPPQVSTTMDQSSGPVVLGELIPGRRELQPVTPTRQGHGPSPLSNGFNVSNRSQQQSNGSTIPSRGGVPYDDSEMMMGYQHSAVQPQPNEHSRAGFLRHFATPSGQNTQQRLSQKSALTHMAANSHAHEYQNSASTTTSGQKTGEKSHRSSGPSNEIQSSNGINRGEHPDFSTMQPLIGGSQVPDTQAEVPIHGSADVDVLGGAELNYSSQSLPASQLSQLSQNVMAPPTSKQHINSLLNNPADALSEQLHAGARQPYDPAHDPANAPPPVQSITIDLVQVDHLHRELVRRSSGLSVEQLEQVNAALMDAVWKKKGEWNRMLVVDAIREAFNETLKDVKACEEIRGPSQP
ncbi:ATPase family AAA domain-containing protein 2 [Cryomyces antarcticus]